MDKAYFLPFSAEFKMQEKLYFGPEAKRFGLRTRSPKAKKKTDKLKKIKNKREQRKKNFIKSFF
jgi:hypothetical protein